MTPLGLAAAGPIRFPRRVTSFNDQRSLRRCLSTAPATDRRGASRSSVSGVKSGSKQIRCFAATIASRCRAALPFNRVCFRNKNLECGRAVKRARADAAKTDALARRRSFPSDASQTVGNPNKNGNALRRHRNRHNRSRQRSAASAGYLPWRRAHRFSGDRLVARTAAVG